MQQLKPMTVLRQLIFHDRGLLLVLPCFLRSFLILLQWIWGLLLPRNVTKSIVNGMFICFFLFFGESTLTVNFCTVGVQINVLLNVNQLREFCLFLNCLWPYLAIVFKSSSPPKEWISHTVLKIYLSSHQLLVNWDNQSKAFCTLSELLKVHVHVHLQSMGLQLKDVTLFLKYGSIVVM